eukprot:3186522-Rhodomonas_salina.1
MLTSLVELNQLTSAYNAPVGGGSAVMGPTVTRDISRVGCTLTDVKGGLPQSRNLTLNFISAETGAVMLAVLNPFANTVFCSQGPLFGGHSW